MMGFELSALLIALTSYLTPAFSHYRPWVPGEPLPIVASLRFGGGPRVPGGRAARQQVAAAQNPAASAVQDNAVALGSVGVLVKIEAGCALVRRKANDAVAGFGINPVAG